MSEKYFCNNCKGLRNHKELHSEKTRGDHGDGFIQWMNDYSIIQCLGCDEISFLEVYGDTEMVGYDEFGEENYYYNKTTYPYHLESGNELDSIEFIPKIIREIYRETISAFKSKSYILTAGGLRAIIEGICNHLKIKKGNLADRIDLLHKKGHLTLGESKRLHSIRFLGNDALHEMEKPKKEPLYILLEIVNHLLSNLFINDKKIKGQMDVIVDKYEDFDKLIRNKINKDMIGQEFTLNQILGKSRRLIAKEAFNDIEKKFKEQITSSTVDYVEIVGDEPDIKYKVIKEPELAF